MCRVFFWRVKRMRRHLTSLHTRAFTARQRGNAAIRWPYQGRWEATTAVTRRREAWERCRGKLGRVAPQARRHQPLPSAVRRAARAPEWRNCHGTVAAAACGEGGGDGDVAVATTDAAPSDGESISRVRTCTRGSVAAARALWVSMLSAWREGERTCQALTQQGDKQATSCEPQRNVGGGKLG